MNKKYIVRLSDEEREYLSGIITKGKAAAYKIRHAHILLKADADGPNQTDEQIAGNFSVHKNTVYGIRQRFVGEGTESALNRKKQENPPRMRKSDGEKEAKPIALGCGSPPEEAGKLIKRFGIHYTPEHGSWLNIAEIGLSVLTRQCPDRRISDMEILRRAAESWEQKRNGLRKGVNWQFRTEDARIKLRRLYPQFQN